MRECPKTGEVQSTSIKAPCCFPKGALYCPYGGINEVTNCCGQLPLLFFCVVACTPGCCSKPSCVCVQMNVCLILYKSAVLSSYDNLMLCSICVLMLNFLLVALMACYMSKPVFTLSNGCSYFTPLAFLSP